MVDRICQTDLPLDDLKDFRMNISGCPNACGNHWAADLGFYGRASHKDGRFYPAYSVVAGGMAKKGTIALGAKIGEVAARYLPALVHDFLEGYARKKSHRCLFREYFETEGIEDLKALCLLYKKPTDYSVNPEMYTDWGTTAPFSLAERGQGECSAGLFDLIDFDLKKARESLTAMLSEKASDKRTFLLRQSVRSSARALLVTRGAEPHSDDHVFDLFIKHFVNTKLIGDRFTPLLATCCSGSMEACDTLESDAHDFLAAIVRLYQSMDDSFHFKSDKAAAVSIAAAAATADEQPKPVFKDLRGVACPMNFVKTKLVLDGMSSHQHLTILLDDGNPIMNVPRSVQGEGHKVLEQTKKGDHWVVLIEKSDG
jgi:sulfite reductase (ferredoxin)